MTLAAPQPAYRNNGLPDGGSLAALVSQALAKLDMGANNEAITLIGDIQAIAPGDPVALHLLGLASFRLEEPGKALAAFEGAHHAAPDVEEYAEALSIVCAKLGDIAASLFYAKLGQASTRKSGFSGLLPVWFGSFEESFFKMADDPIMKQAAAAVADRNWQAAMLLYRKASEVTPDLLPAWRGFVDALCELDQPYEAISALSHVTRLAPNDPVDFIRYSRTFELAGYWEEALSAAHGAAISAPADAALGWQAVRLNFADPGSTQGSVIKAAKRWAENTGPSNNRAAVAFGDSPPLELRRLKLGVFSSHWMEGDGLDLIEPLLAALPRRSIDLYVYADDIARSALAIRVRGFAGHWQEVGDLDDDTIAFMMANDTLDALIDLDGPLRRKRHSLFARRPVACMLTLSDLPEAAACAGFDGVIGDEYFYSADESTAIVSLPGVLTLPSDQMPAPPRQEDRISGSVIFGTLAPRREITGATVAVWSQILKNMPGSMLYLMPERMGGASGLTEIVELFGTALADRIVLVTGDQIVGGYISTIDVLLDPIDSSNTEEAIAAAAMGMPIVTLPGTLPARNLLAGWLTRLGMDDLVAKDAGAYMGAAIQAADTEINAAMRERLAKAADFERKEGGTVRARTLEAGLRRVITARVGQP